MIKNKLINIFYSKTEPHTLVMCSINKPSNSRKTCVGWTIFFIMNWHKYEFIYDKSWREQKKANFAVVLIETFLGFVCFQQNDWPCGCFRQKHNFRLLICCWCCVCFVFIFNYIKIIRIPVHQLDSRVFFYVSNTLIHENF